MFNILGRCPIISCIPIPSQPPSHIHPGPHGGSTWHRHEHPLPTIPAFHGPSVYPTRPQTCWEPTRHSFSRAHPEYDIVADDDYFTETFDIPHVFSCEMNPAKRAWIRTLFPGLESIYDDITELMTGTANDYSQSETTPTRTRVTSCTIWICGFA